MSTSDSENEAGFGDICGNNVVSVGNQCILGSNAQRRMRLFTRANLAAYYAGQRWTLGRSDENCR